MSNQELVAALVAAYGFGYNDGMHERPFAAGERVQALADSLAELE